VVLSLGASASFGSPSAQTQNVPGVTPRLITLGLNVAQSGAAAPITLAYVQGIQTFWYDQNARGGVCGRQVRLIYGDNGGNPQQGVTVYTQMSPQVLAFQHLSPSSVLLALAPQWTKDNIMVSASSTVSALFGEKNYIPINQDWGHAIVSSVDWLMKNRGLRRGDTIAVLHGVGAYGDDAKNGTEWVAQRHGLKVVSQQVAATDTEMSAPMLAFRQADAKVAFLVALAPQQNNAIAAADAINYRPIHVAASFLPSAMTTTIAPTLKSNRYYVMGNGGGPAEAPLSSTGAAV
jgi:ABC-type branched-subunit amino acid transport system substrate-binding protein